MSVETALASERNASEPRVIRFLDTYSLPGARQRFRSGNRVEPQRSATAPPSAPGSRRDEGPDLPARHELTGESPRLLLDLLQGPRLVDHLDGRTVAALVRNDCAAVRNQWVFATPAARTVMRQHLLSLARASPGRAAALFPAIAELVDSIPGGSEIPLGSGPAAAADILIALYDAALAAGQRARKDSVPGGTAEPA